MIDASTERVREAKISMGKQIFEWVTRNPRQGVAAVLFVVGGLLGLWVTDYVIGQIGSESPELALSYNIMRVCTFVLFGLLATSLVWGKAGAR